eukprot:SM000135S27024  [mRNA]  locus=s135:274725:278243:- [translate_table: standard]
MAAAAVGQLLRDADGAGAALGLSPAVSRFLMALLLSLPAQGAHRLVPSATGKHVYAAATGGGLCWLAYGGGSAAWHLLAPAAFAYAAMVVDRRRCGGVAFAGSFAFLAYCHVKMLSGQAWRQGGMDFTGSLMVLTLKVVSCAMDYQDGLLPADKAASPMYTNRLKVLPSPLEFAGYILCCGNVLVGPTIDFRGYRSYCERRAEWDPRADKPMPSVLPTAITRLVQAACCAALYQTLVPRFPGKCGYIWMAALTMRIMYYFIWSLAETGLLLSGLGFSGWSKSTPSEPEWKRADHVKPLKVELIPSAAKLPSYWNMKTAEWLRIYVYDRLNLWVGRPTFGTLLATQVVSAVWHGVYPGYYLFFVNCAVAQQASKAYYKLHLKIPEKSSLLQVFSNQFHWLFTQLVLNYSQVGFILLHARQTLDVWTSVYFVGNLLPLAVLWASGLLKSRRTSKVD